MRISDWSSDVCSSDLEDTPFTPPLPPVVQRLVRTIRARRITPPQPVAVDEDDPAQHPPILNPRLAMALGKVRLQTRDRKSVVSGKSVSVRVDLGGRRIIKKKKIQQ